MGTITNSFDPTSWHLPDEHIHDDIPYMGAFVPEQVPEAVKQWLPEDEDIVIASYPKAGTTLSSTIVQYILADGSPQSSVGLHSLPFIEHQKPGSDKTNLELNNTLPKPRISKTHFGYPYLKNAVEKGKGKILVVMRNPKDAIVSYYNHYQNGHMAFTGSFSEFFELVKVKNINRGDVFDWYRAWWGARDHPNVMVIMFEDMVKKPFESVKKISSFIGRSLSDEVTERIVEATSFKTMSKEATFDKVYKDSEKLSKAYYRKGEAGDWINWFDDEQNKWLDAKCEELAKEGIEFTFE